jgi:hypothetical protein
MYVSNRKARDWLLSHGYDHVWFKRHTKRKDLVFTLSGSYTATDLWNLFDGIALTMDNKPCFFQVKTNAWPPMKPLMEFKNGNSFEILCLNVQGKYVKIRKL